MKKISGGTLMEGYGSPETLDLCKQECNVRPECMGLDWSDFRADKCRLYTGDDISVGTGGLGYIAVICDGSNDGEGGV